MIIYNRIQVENISHWYSNNNKIMQKTCLHHNPQLTSNRIQAVQ